MVTRCDTGPGWRIISQPNCAALPTAATLPDARTWPAPLLIMHACCMCLGASHPASCMQRQHASCRLRHPPGQQAPVVAHSSPHHTGMRLLLLAGAGACAVPCCTMPQDHSTDGCLPAPAGAIRSMKRHLQPGSQFISLEGFGVQSACFLQRKAGACDVVLLSV
jgi:hypothetical protein